MRGLTSETFKSVGCFQINTDYYFPIISVYGKRLGCLIHLANPKKSQGKYLTELTERGAFLYNEQILPHLFYGQPVVLVEGLYDCLSLHQFKVPCVATTTNEATLGKLYKIWRYTDKILLWPDSDNAGEEGLEKTLKRAKKIGFKVTIFNIRDFKDANDYLMRHPDEFKQVIVPTIIDCLKEMSNG